MLVNPPLLQGDIESFSGRSCLQQMGYNGTVSPDEGSFGTHIRLVRGGNGSATALLSTASAMWPHDFTVDPVATAAETVAAYAKALPAMRSSHLRWWHEWWPASFVSIPDATVLSFYWLQMAQIGFGMRENGPVRDEIGPWYIDMNPNRACPPSF